jgi:26S proteasome regulatory subunit N8
MLPLQVIYLSSLIRSILALHKLIDNKEQLLWQEREAAKPKEADGKDKSKEGAEAADAKKGAADGKENSKPADATKK